MRRLLFVFVAIVVVASVISCGMRSDGTDAFSSITQMVDSAKAQNKPDTVVVVQPVEEPVVAEPADELFDDFLSRIAKSTRFQLRRVRFPLPFTTHEDTLEITKNNWNHDWLFFQEDFYTMLFDQEEDMDYEGDTALVHVQVEWIYLNTFMQKTYDFQRKNGAWMLDSIDMRPLHGLDEDSFIEFYREFATDSIFQSNHVANPIEFVTIDPDDDFSILETTLGISQWMAFRPELPTEMLSNIDYGQDNRTDSRTKVLKICGVDNGLSLLLYFHKRAKGWEMYKYEDTST